MKVTVKANPSTRRRLQAAHEAAARAVLAELGARFQDAIRKPVWEWNLGPTVRSNGQIVNTPRNIVDAATLAQSQTLKITGTTAVYKWTAANKKGVGYSTAVHEGATLSNGTILPARPWTAAVLGTERIDGIPVYNWKERYRDAWKRAIG
jgi:hypothetical protein